MKALVNSILIITSLAVLAPAYSAQDQLLLDQVHKSQKLRQEAKAEKAAKEKTSALVVDAPLRKTGE